MSSSGSGAVEKKTDAQEITSEETNDFILYKRGTVWYGMSSCYGMLTILPLVIEYSKLFKSKSELSIDMCALLRLVAKSMSELSIDICALLR